MTTNMMKLNIKFIGIFKKFSVKLMIANLSAGFRTVRALL